jgi:hypothetical protein
VFFKFYFTYFLMALRFELRVLPLLGRWSAVLDQDPSVYASYSSWKDKCEPPQPAFCCWDGVLLTFCLGLPQTTIIPMSASQVARIKARATGCPALSLFFRGVCVCVCACVIYQIYRKVARVVRGTAEESAPWFANYLRFTSFVSHFSLSFSFFLLFLSSPLFLPTSHYIYVFDKLFDSEVKIIYPFFPQTFSSHFLRTSIFSYISIV